MKAIGSAIAGGAMTLQLFFAVPFMATCEVPNWMLGPRQSSACLERWYVVLALLFPSSVQAVAEERASRRRGKDGRFLSEEEV